MDVLTAQVGDGVAAAVGHDDVVPGAERGGREALGATGILLGTPRGHDHGAAWGYRLHSTLEGLQDAIALLPLFLLTRLNLPQLTAVVPHHLFPGVSQTPAQRQQTDWKYLYTTTQNIEALLNNC